MGHLLEPVGGATEQRPGSHGWTATLDPRVRLITACLFASVVVSLVEIVALLLALALAILLLVIMRLPLGPILRRLAGMDGFMLLILILLPFTIPGTPLLAWGGLTASAEGLREALEIMLKANAIVLVLLLLVGSLDPVTLGHALARLRVPAALVMLLFFTVRYIDVIGDEYARLRIAMRARGFRPRNDWQTYRSLGYLVGMLLVRSLERSERILAAMRCRGFQGQFHLLDDLVYRRADVLFAGVMAGALVALVLVGQ